MRNSRYSRKIGVIDYFCIGFGAIIGVGWAVSINDWMTVSGGPIPAALGYVLAMIVMVPIALCFCELIPMFPAAGGSMLFSYSAFSAPVAAITGWAAFGASVSLLPWEAIQITDILEYLLPGIKNGPPLYSVLGSEIHLPTILIGIGLSVSLFLINLHGLKTASVLQRYLVVVLILAAAFASIASVLAGNMNNVFPNHQMYSSVDHSSSAPSSFMSGVLAILITAPFFLSGFETIPQGIEEAGGDVKKVGKTVVLSVVCACLFYSVLLICFGIGIPWTTFAELPHPAVANLFLTLYPSKIGSVLYWIIIIGAIAGLITSWNSFFSASANLLMGMSRGGLIPELFQKQTKSGAAKFGLIACLVISSAGPLLGPKLINAITCFSSSAFVLSWTMTAWSLVRLRITRPAAIRPYRIPGGIITALFAALSSSIILIGMFIPISSFYIGSTASLMFFLWIVLGLILYLTCSKQRKGISKETFLNQLLCNTESGKIQPPLQ